jgi:hypothetical protein
MMRHVYIAVFFILTLALVSCGSGSGDGVSGGNNANSTSVIINLGQRDINTGTLKAQAIPESIRTVMIKITAPDMKTIQRTIDVTGMNEVRETFEVPNGMNRHIEIFAYDINNVLRFYGHSYVNLHGAPVTVTIVMVNVDENHPEFAGLENAVPLSPHTAELSWRTAVDDFTPPEAISYLIFLALNSGGQNFEFANQVVVGQTSITLEGLEPETTYYAVVLAEDEAGNVSSIVVELDFTTFPIPDTTPPEFDGIQSATALSSSEIMLQWNPAVDPPDVVTASDIGAYTTSPEDIEYLVYQAVQPGGQDFFNPTYITNPGALSFTANDLDSNTLYCYVVRARDLSGNINQNTREICEQTFIRQYTLTVTIEGTGTGSVTSNPAGITCGGDCSEVYDDGTEVTLTTEADAGSVFSGWSGDPDCSDSMVTVNADKTCTAIFTLEQHTLTVVKAGAGSGTVTSNPAGITCGGDCSEVYDDGTEVTLTAAADAGSVFSSWSGDPDCSDSMVTMNADKTCIATFTLICIPDLILPLDGATMMDNGCDSAPESIIWDFDWSGCAGASQYHLYVKHPDALIPVIDETGITSSSYHYDSLSGYIEEANRFGWEWKVRAMVGGQWGDWSGIRTFDVEPLNWDCQLF